MKTCGALLMLLCCCVAHTQLRAEDISHNDIKLTPDEVTGAAAQRTGAALTASSQQTCQPDIHTVLREMNALIVEQRVELRHTKTQLETLESRLRASEKTVEDQKVELTHTKTQLQTLEKNGDAVESRLTTSEKTVEDQKVELTHTRTQLEAVESRLTTSESLISQLKTENEDMRREREQSRVSFSTILLKEGYAEVGPSAVDTPLVFRNVITNVGDAYSAISGVFRAPIRGVYFFVVFMYGHGHSSISSSITLWKNKGQVVIAYARSQPVPNSWTGMSSSNGASLLLEVGDEVYVKLFPGARVFDNENHHTTFSGHLFFPM